MKEFQVDNLHIHVHSTHAELGRRAAYEAAHALHAAITAKGAARIILASAPSQDEFLAALRGAPGVDWSRVTIFHLDEYIGLEASHPANFRTYLQHHLLDHIAAARFHGIRGEARDPEAECLRYAALLAEAPIDLVCLGIGENAHIAFNDPPVTDFEDPLAVKTVDLDEASRHQQVNDECFPDSNSVPLRAITLTVPTIMAAHRLIGVVPGLRKAAAVRAAVEDPISPLCPATILRTHPQAKLHLDSDSASYCNAVHPVLFHV
ncbi:MAG: glucosamine-6-phosphate deaminase [Verrucomicrobiota bacterium]